MNAIKLRGFTVMVFVLIAAISYFTTATFATDYKTVDNNVITAIKNFDNDEAAASYIRNQMKQRETTITFEYTTKEKHSEILHYLIEKAVTHTGVPTEGDYLKCQLEHWEGKYSYTKTGDTYDMCVTYYVNYFTDYEQEQETDSTVANVISKLRLDGKSDYDKVKEIYDYVCENVNYDYEDLNNNDNKTKYTAYSALNSNKAVCQGYALLIYRLMLESGIDCRVVSGDGDGKAHSWNIVKVGASYYNLDATWDSQLQEKMYFLKCDEEFIRHIRYEEYRTTDFYANYPMSENNYEEFNSHKTDKTITPKFVWNYFCHFIGVIFGHWFGYN